MAEQENNFPPSAITVMRISWDPAVVKENRVFSPQEME